MRTFANLAPFGVALLMVAACSSSSNNDPSQPQSSDDPMADEPIPMAPSNENGNNSPTEIESGPTSSIAGLWDFTYTGDINTGGLITGVNYMLINSNGTATSYFLASDPSESTALGNCFNSHNRTIDSQGNEEFLFTPTDDADQLVHFPNLYRIMRGFLGLELTQIFESSEVENGALVTTGTEEYSWTARELVGMDPIDIPICDN